MIKKCGLSILLVLCSCTTTAPRPEHALSAESLIDEISKSLPAGWEVVSIEEGKLPHGHYWSDDYPGSHGTQVIVQGPKDVYCCLYGADDNPRLIAVAKESLEICIMPSGYRLDWKRHFLSMRPVTATRICVADTGVIFGYPTFRPKTFEQLVNHSSGISRPNSAGSESPISWLSWNKDLASMLVGIDG